METVSVNLTKTQAEVLRAIVSNVVVNNQLTPLYSIVASLNAMATKKPEELGMTAEMVQSFQNVFSNVSINGVTLPIQVVIDIFNSINTAINDNPESNVEVAEDAIPQEASQETAAETTN